LDFETKIMVKLDAPQLLRKELSSRRWEPKVVLIGTNTDAYQPIERKLELTRRCLEVFLEFRNPATVISKNFLITRDIDILSAMAKENLTQASVSVTTLDAELARIMEPRTAAPRRRLEAIRMLAEAGIPTCVMVSPVIPGLTDHEIPSIVEAAAAAGAKYACLQLVRLSGPVGTLFENWLARHMPDRKEKVLNRIREMHGGALSDPRFGHRMSCEGVFAEQIRGMFKLACRKAGFDHDGPELCTDQFRRPGDGQMSLFE
jgi:DNA repair photolyase